MAHPEDVLDEIERKRRYSWFVSYNHGMGVGSVEAYTDGPIDCWARVEELTEIAARASNRVMPGRILRTSDIVILNWILLSGPED